jgi:peptide-methionine (S)-S-oxide reductase
VKLNRLRLFVGLLLVVGLTFGYVWTQDQPTRGISIEEIPMSDNVEVATLGAGCFWCVEAVFQDVKGVHKVESGYTGGHVENPTYKQICTGTTGHAEVAQITFDPTVISFEDILMIFWHTHDPTTLNRQGNDAGTQYRSAIFYHNEKQKEIAEKSKAETEASDLWPNPIVTEITPLDVYYPAEDYHQNYFNNNPYQPYCMMVVNPKVQKFRKSFGEWLK